MHGGNEGTTRINRDFTSRPLVDGDDVLDDYGQGSGGHIFQRTDLQLAGEIVSEIASVGSFCCEESPQCLLVGG